MNGTPGYNQSIYRYNFTPEQMRYYFMRPPERPIKQLLFTLILYSLVILAALLLLILLFVHTSVSSSSTSLLAYSIMLIMLIVLIAFIRKGYVTATKLRREWVAYSEEKKHLPPTEDQYQAWLDERCYRLYDRAMQKLRPDHIESTLSLVGSVLPPAQENPLVRKRQNGGVHSSINTCKYVFLTRDNMKVFSSEIDAFTFDQGLRVERSSHYFYEHIASVSLDDVGLMIPVGDPPQPYTIGRQYFSFAIDNGDVIRLGITAASLRSSRGSFNNIEEVVANFLMLLHDHKVSRVEAYRQ